MKSRKHSLSRTLSVYVFTGSPTCLTPLSKIVDRGRCGLLPVCRIQGRQPKFHNTSPLIRDQAGLGHGVLCESVLGSEDEAVVLAVR